jgi:hypothetical protein
MKCHVFVADELPTLGAAEGGVVRKEAGIVLHEFLLLGELDIGEGGVFFVELEIRPV